MNYESNGIITKIYQTHKLQTCEHCGHTGFDVVERTYHVCGVLESSIECISRTDCWLRWDRTNKFTLKAVTG